MSLNIYPATPCIINVFTDVSCGTFVFMYFLLFSMLFMYLFINNNNPHYDLLKLVLVWRLNC